MQRLFGEGKDFLCNTIQHFLVSANIANEWLLFIPLISYWAICCWKVISIKISSVYMSCKGKFYVEIQWNSVRKSFRGRAFEDALGLSSFYIFFDNPLESGCRQCTTFWSEDFLVSWLLHRCVTSQSRYFAVLRNVANSRFWSQYQYQNSAKKSRCRFALVWSDDNILTGFLQKPMATNLEILQGSSTLKYINVNWYMIFPNKIYLH